MNDADIQLEQAACSGDAQRARDALQAGADPNRTLENPGPSILHLAAAAGQAQIAGLLLDSGAAPSLETFDADGCSPLMMAVQSGHLETVRTLLDRGADVNARAGPDGNTALRIAAADGSFEMVKLLVSAGADPLIPGRLTLTALDRAAERRTPEGYRILNLLNSAVETARKHARAKARAEARAKVRRAKDRPSPQKR